MLSEFVQFDKLVNPTGNEIYLPLSRTTTGKGTPVDLETAKTYMASDNLLELGMFMPPNVCCIEIKDQAVADLVKKIGLDIAIFKFKDKFHLYSNETALRNTTNNTLGCGVAGNIHVYAKKSSALILPFKPSDSKSEKLEDAEVVHMPSTLGPLPSWLMPIFKVSRPTPELDMTFPLSEDIGLELVNLFKFLTKSGFSGVSKKKILNAVNENLTLEPVNEDDLKLLFTEHMLDKEISDFFGPKGEFYHHKLGAHLIETLHIKKCSTNKKLYFWDEQKKLYINNDDVISGIMTRLCPSIKEFQRAETVKYIESVLSLDSAHFNANPFTVVFKNGILDIETMELKEMTPDYYENIQINCNFDPDAKSPIADEFFDTASQGDKKIEQLLYEAIGYSMIKTNELEKSFVLLGSGRNGKSTYLELIKKVLGEQNITTLSLKDLALQFRVSSLDNKLASLAGDISNQKIPDTDLFKNINSGDSVYIEEKHRQGVSKKLFSTLFFAANKLPPTPDTSFGFFRKLCIIPFIASLDKVNRVDGLFFRRKLLSKESLDYVAYKAVMAIHNVISTTFDFTRSERVDRMITNYKRDNNNVLVWAQRLYRDDRNEMQKVSFSKAYENYKDWTVEKGYKHFHENNFKKTLEEEYKLIIDGAGKFQLKEKQLDIFDYIDPIEEEEDVSF